MPLVVSEAPFQFLGHLLLEFLGDGLLEFLDAVLDFCELALLAFLDGGGPGGLLLLILVHLALILLHHGGKGFFGLNSSSNVP